MSKQKKKKKNINTIRSLETYRQDLFLITTDFSMINNLYNTSPYAGKTEHLRELIKDMSLQINETYHRLVKQIHDESNKI